MEHEAHKYRSSVRAAMGTSSVIWDRIAYRLKDFHKYFELPQLVCVEDGYYDEKDETTLSRDDILTLHILQKTRFFKAVDKNAQEINIPVNLAAKVETIPDEPTRTCHSIKELINVSADRVKSVHGHPWLLIQAGDTLQIREVIDDMEVESLILSFLSRNQDDVNIPVDYKAEFQVLPDITKLWLTEVENTFELPVRIRFTDETLQINASEDGTLNCEGISTIADLGDVTLQSIFQTEQYVASTKNENRTVVLKIPVEADITVKAGVGIEEGDYTYVEVCQLHHDRARLHQLDEFDVDCIKIGETDAKVERIYEFVDEFSDEDDEHYEDPAPKVPSRENRPPLHPVNNNSDDDDTSSDYEEYVPETQPPPIPTRITSLRHNADISDNQNICTRIRNALCCLRRPENLSNSASKAEANAFEEPNDVQKRYVQPESSIRSNNPASRSNAAFEESEEDNTVSTGFSERLDLLSVEEVCQCLRGLNMEQYVEMFRMQQIDGGLFVELTDDVLVSLGVSSEFHRKKLAKFIQGWRPDQNVAQN